MPMEIPRLVHVWPIKGYRLLLEYEGQVKRVFDASYLIKDYWHNERKESEYFDTVHLSGDGIAWAGGQNVEADELWDASKEV